MRTIFTQAPQQSHPMSILRFALLAIARIGFLPDRNPMLPMAVRLLP